MLQRKRTQRGEQIINRVTKNNTNHSKGGGQDCADRELRIGEYIESKVTKEVLAMTKVGKEKQSRPQSRKNSKKALQGITNEGIKNKIQRAIENNKEYLSSVASQQQTTPNNHYFQGHYQKMFTKQAKQLEQQKIQSALIVRNIKTLSKIADSTEVSQIKKTDNSTLLQDDITNIKNGGDYIPHHNVTLRAKTLIPNSSQNQLVYQNAVGNQEQFFTPYTRNNHESCENINDYIKEVSESIQNKQLEFNSQPYHKNLHKLEDINSPQQQQQIMKSARNNFPDDYLTQELAIKSFTELDVDGRLTQLYGLPFPKKPHPILQNKQNSLKIDTFNKFIQLSYGTGYNYYDPSNPLLPQIAASTNIDNFASQSDQIYPSMLSQIAKQHLIHSMHSPNKIKTKQDIIKKSILDNQLIEGAWIIEPNFQSKGMNEIVIKGQQVANKFVQIGGVKPNEIRRKANLQSARGHHQQEGSHGGAQGYSSHHQQQTPVKKNRKDHISVNRAVKERFDNRSIDFRDQKGFEQNLLLIDEEGIDGKSSIISQQRPMSKQHKTHQRLTIAQTTQNNIKTTKPAQPLTNTHQQKNSLDINRLKKPNNSISETIKTFGSQPQIKDNQKLQSLQQQDAQLIKDSQSQSITAILQLPQSQQNEDQKEDSTKCNSEENPLQLQGNQQIPPKNNYSFRPRRPIVNPVEQARLEQERLIQLKHEAKEKYHQFSLQNKQNNAKYKYIICAGNNSQIVKRCMELRKDRWEETNDFDTLFNFKWHPISKGIKFEQVNTHGTRQLVNHFENHDCFTTKDQMFKNLLLHCESRKLNVFDFVPVTFLLEVDSINYAFELEKFITYFTYIEKLIGSKPLHVLKADPELMQGVLNNINNKYQNHQMCKDEKGPFYAKRRIPDSHFKAHNIWILKATGFNRGRGIHVFNKLEDLKKLIREYTDGVNFENQLGSQHQTNKLLNKQIQVTTTQNQTQPQSFSNVENVPSYLKSTSFVIQKYVEVPLLLRSRKFDIRVWVVITHDAKCYFFKEGYIRTSCEEYSLSQDSISKASVHLTNNAVQKFAENYGKFEDGNQLGFQDLQNILNEEQNDSARTSYVIDELIPKMKEFINLSLESVRKKLKVGKGCFFELFGYDFMIDGDYQPWLIEVNTNPCLEESSQLLCKYMPRMINDMLKLTLDQAFPTKKGQQDYEASSMNVFQIDKYSNEENMWDFLCQLDYNQGGAANNNNYEKQGILGPLKK